MLYSIGIFSGLVENSRFSDSLDRQSPHTTLERLRYDRPTNRLSDAWESQEGIRVVDAILH